MDKYSNTHNSAYAISDVATMSTTACVKSEPPLSDRPLMDRLEHTENILEMILSVVYEMDGRVNGENKLEKVEGMGACGLLGQALVLDDRATEILERLRKINNQL